MPLKSFYITTPIYYVNDRPHLGHAYTSLACDVLARFKRQDGYAVKFLTGTDEHGQKVEKSAQKAGISPLAFADRTSGQFKALAQLMQLSNDDFIRTTEARHMRAAQSLWQRMQERGHIYLGSYAGWYAVRDEAYYQESELIGGKAPTGAEVEWVEEPSYFFNLSQWQEKLLAWYRNNPDCIAPASRRNEVMRFVEGGLKDLSISRTTFTWGIPVPGDPEHIMYVWLDALANYLSGLGYPEQTEEYRQFWPPSLHIMGKDILRFHAVYWPAFLMAAELPLPKRIFAHGWWTVEGEKMSKSLGNAVFAEDLVARYGLDQTRWFLLREVPFGQDGNFAREAAYARINSDLANNIGNLVQRTLSLVHKNCGGLMPAANPAVFEAELQAHCYRRTEILRGLMDAQQFHLVCEEIVQMANAANLYIDRMAPWALKKTDPKKMANVLNVLVEVIRCLAIKISSLMPNSSSKILDMLNIAAHQRDLDSLSPSCGIAEGAALREPVPVFPRLSDSDAANAGG